MLGHPQAVVDRAISCFSIGARRLAYGLGGHAGNRFGGLRGVAWLTDKGAPAVIGLGIAALGHECLVFKTFGDHHVPQRVDQRHISTWAQRQMLGLAHVRGL